MQQADLVSVWYDQQPDEAIFMSAIVENIDLTSATFKWSLYNANIQQIILEGTLIMDGIDFIEWSENSDTNYAPYYWISKQLNLTIL